MLCNSLCEKVNSLMDTELSFMFVCGSRARGNHKENSDIDLFVVLNDNYPLLQNRISDVFVKFHIDNNLDLDHIGEILSIHTMDLLLNERAYSEYIANGFFESACYNQQCILSTVRKAFVVANMLTDRRILEKGDINALNIYSFKAQQIMSKSKNVQLFSLGTDPEFGTQVDASFNLLYREMKKSIISGQLRETTLGINLQNWFTSRYLKIRKNQNNIVNNLNEFSPVVCPLTTRKNFNLFEGQCVGCNSKN